eukprot:849803-Karenia_brevis.AAC.1
MPYEALDSVLQLLDQGNVGKDLISQHNTEILTKNIIGLASAHSWVVKGKRGDYRAKKDEEHITALDGFTTIGREMQALADRAEKTTKDIIANWVANTTQITETLSSWIPAGWMSKKDSILKETQVLGVGVGREKESK